MTCSPSKNLIEQNSDVVVTSMVGKISTSIDNSFVYDYKKTKFVPPNGKTLLIQGQTKEGINEYRDYFQYKEYPGAWSAYWAVTQSTGIKEPFVNITRSTQDHQFLVEHFDNMALHSAMWLVGKWDVAKNTYSGMYDGVIKEYCDWVKTVNRPVYLRIGYEFDGPHNLLEPIDYVKAYKHVVNIMRKEGVTNVAYVWHSYASKPYKEYPVKDWYPGDDYVDWVAISVFFQPYEDIFNHRETNDVLNFAKSHKKPVMIAEANPVLGISKKDTNVWDEWFVDFFSFCYEKNIKAIAFINEDWQRLDIDGIEDWKDARLYNNDIIAKAWIKEVSKDRYLKQSTGLFEQLGYLKE
ncbi:glycoside hydrolase family 26 protein [Winogradskyella sp.]|uniref:glycoside hydrolase family 26 protein n=1 Tax=Winogradskyella sp. TaxID=1883156 RepID=UPI00261A5D99|nr:glycosyl hydrolase [Winogradskyella sp.]